MRQWLRDGLERILTAYQRTVSPDHGRLRRFFPLGWCRFSPSCSEFGRQAIRRYGAGRGLVLFLARLGRCHPWHAGGYDPVPETHNVPRRTVTTPDSSDVIVVRPDWTPPYDAQRNGPHDPLTSDD